MTARRRLLFDGEIVSDAWGGGTFVHCHNALLHFLVGNGEPLVLPQMLKPGFDQELFHISTRSGGFDKKAPLQGAVTTSDRFHTPHLGYEFLNALAVDFILHRDEDWRIFGRSIQVRFPVSATSLRA